MINDYTQVVFHKTVVALELVLKDVIRRMLALDLLDFSGEAIAKMIDDGIFANLDDQFLIGKFRSALTSTTEDDLRTKILAILNRRPPKLIASSEIITESSERSRGYHKTLKQQLGDKVSAAAEKFGINNSLWYLWDRSLGLSKIGSKVPPEVFLKGNFEDDASQAVRVLRTDPNAVPSSSRPLIELDSALMNQLSQCNLYVIRLYVHLPPEAETKDLRLQIVQYFRDELPNFPFLP